MSEPNGQVSYSVKELIAKLDGKIDGLFLAIGNKADKQEVAELEKQVLELKLSQARLGGGRDWLWRTLAALPGIAALAVYFQH